MSSSTFVWFVGVVEDRDDPEKIGRVRVRIHGVHSDKKSIAPTSQLPWAHIMNSPTSASINGIGTSPVGLAVGTTVVGFFMDGDRSNIPVVMGTLTSTGNMPKESIGIDSTKKIPVIGEPKPAFAAKYPYNKVTKTESGHIIEIDDTPNNERIHIYHKSGSYIEINKNGKIVKKTFDDDVEVVLKDKEIITKGNITISSTGDITLLAGGALYLNP